MARFGRAAAETRDSTRRRFARRRWSRRWLAWRPIAAALIVVLLAGFAVYGVYFSSWLRTEGVQVSGLHQLKEGQVLAVAEVPTGGPLARVDLHAIELRVLALPAVKSVDVSRKWPHDVRIEVVERTPIAVERVRNGFVEVDASGQTFGHRRVAPPGLPRIEEGAEADATALAEAAKVIASLDPSVARRVEHLSVDSVDQIQLHLRDGSLVKWGSSESSTDKAKVLLALLKTHAHLYDVSVPGQPTTK